MRKRLMELRQRAEKLSADAAALLDEADSEGRDLTEAETSKYNEIEAELADVLQQVQAGENTSARRASLTSTAAALAIAPALAVASPDEQLLQTGGFANIAEFAVAVRQAAPQVSGIVDPRLNQIREAEMNQLKQMGQPANFHSGSGADGEGFMLPTQFREEVWELMLGMEDLLTTVDLEDTSARQVDYVADESTPWGASGVQAYWRGEAEKMIASKLATDGRSLTLHEIYAFVIATEELLEDAPRLNGRLTRRSAEAINWKVNDSIVYGTGSGQPRGVAGHPSEISVAKESSQAADTIVADNVLKMFSRLMVAPGDSPYWLATRDVVPQLAQMTIGQQPVWTPPNGLIDAPGGFLLGYPIRFTEHASQLGSKGDIRLWSPRGYYAVRRTQGLQFASSMHLFFDYNMQAFRWTFRFAGQPHLSAPVQLPRNQTTKSHFVTLDERS